MRRITVSLKGIEESQRRQQSRPGAGALLLIAFAFVAVASWKATPERTGQPPAKSDTATVTDTVTTSGTSTTATDTVTTSGTSTTTSPPLTPAALGVDQRELRFTAPGTQVIQLTNTGEESLTIQPAEVTGSFRVTSDCSAPLGRNQSCRVSVALDPTADASSKGELRINSNGGSATITLIASVSPTPAVELQPVNFGRRLLGTAGKPISVRYTNPGPMALSLGAPSTDGPPFRVAQDNCRGMRINPGNRCEVILSFDPNRAGPQTGALRISTADGRLVARAVLSGEAATPLSRPINLQEVSFVRVAVGTDAKPRAVRLANDTPGPLSVGGAVTDPPFKVVLDECRKTQLAPGAGCNVWVTFSPTAEGPIGKELRILNLEGKLIARGDLDGEAIIVTPRPQIQLKPVDFGRQTAGQPSKPRVVQLRNTTSASLSVGAASTSLPFRIVKDGCLRAKLPPGGGCDIMIDFTPSGQGQKDGEIQITASDGYVIAKGSASGYGVVPPPPAPVKIDIEPRAINFHGDPGTKTIVIMNHGGEAVNIKVRIEPKTNYTLDASGCDGMALWPEKQCRISITGTPSAIRLGETASILIGYASQVEVVTVSPK